MLQQMLFDIESTSSACPFPFRWHIIRFIHLSRVTTLRVTPRCWSRYLTRKNAYAINIESPERKEPICDTHIDPSKMLKLAGIRGRKLRPCAKPESYNIFKPINILSLICPGGGGGEGGEIEKRDYRTMKTQNKSVHDRELLTHPVHLARDNSANRRGTNSQPVSTAVTCKVPLDNYKRELTLTISLSFSFFLFSLSLLRSRCSKIAAYRSRAFRDGVLRAQQPVVATEVQCSRCSSMSLEGDDIEGDLSVSLLNGTH